MQAAGMAVTAARMRAIEAAAIASGAVTGAELMDRAGRGAAARIAARWPGPGRRAAVFCGPGNNGGDGYVIASALAGLGWDVALRSADAAEIAAGRFRPGDAGAAARAFVAAGGAVLPPDAPAGPADVLVDALLGIGQVRAADALLAPLHAARAASPGAAVVAVDVPTGRCADTGRALAALPVAPDLCITFHAEKPVHALLRAAGCAVEVVDIGLHPAAS